MTKTYKLSRNLRSAIDGKWINEPADLGPMSKRDAIAYATEWAGRLPVHGDTISVDPENGRGHKYTVATDGTVRAYRQDGIGVS